MQLLSTFVTHINEYARRLIAENPQVTGSHRIFERHRMVHDAGR
jgi:hypothetical protein